MMIGELMTQMSIRFRGLENEDAAAALASDYRVAGIEDGPALQEAWDRCRAGWTKQTAPRPAEFKQYVRETETTVATGRAFKLDFNKYLKESVDEEGDSKQRIVELYGNPKAAEYWDGRRMPCWMADENRWMDLLHDGLRLRVERYVKLKLAHDDGFGEADKVAAAKALIMPTLETVADAKERWPKVRARQERIAAGKG